ncbi:hypothetical protein VOLCADRAFT_115881, partial [Volvox carteri f. nagariensis]
ELTLQRLDELNADSLITVMFAFTQSHYSPHPRIQHRMAAATKADMASFTPRQLEHVACSLAALSYRPSEGWLDNFAHALQVNWNAFLPSQLAVTLVQAAACGLTHLPAATLQDQLPALLRQGVGPSSTMDPATLAKLVWILKLAPLGPEGKQAAVEGKWLDSLVAALQQHLNPTNITVPTASRQEEGEPQEGLQEHQKQGAWEGNRIAKGVWEADVAGCSRAGYGEVQEGAGAGGGGGGGSMLVGHPSSRQLHPADVALVLSSLAGLGRQLLPEAARGEFQRYWLSGSGARWAALAREERLVMSLLGYGPTD